MTKKIYQNINLTCIFQDTAPNFMQENETSGGEKKVESNRKILSGMLSQGTDGGVLFQETIPRKREIRNNRLYEGRFVNIVRRKDGGYYVFMKSFKPEDLQNKSTFAFKVYCEIGEALKTIE